MDHATCKACSIPELLKNIPGILAASIDEDCNELYIVYDLEEIDYAYIDDLLEQVGITQEDNLWEHLKESFIRFAEENEKANLDAHVTLVSYSPMEDIDEALEDKD